jgi:PIN domain nuclease of toxin-antitoxin system
VKLLPDTHAFLWFTLDDPRLSSEVSDLMRDPANELVLSVASSWEIAIKLSIGKYELPGDFESFMKEQIETNQLTFQSITIPHLAIVRSLPFHHRDPFDRLLVAQALAEAVPIISVDERLDAYGIQRIW